MTAHFPRLTAMQRLAAYRLEAAKAAKVFRHVTSNVIQMPSASERVDAYIAGRPAPRAIESLVAEYNRLRDIVDSETSLPSISGPTPYLDAKMNVLYDAMESIVKGGL